MQRNDSETTGGRLHARIADILAAEIAGGVHPPGRHMVETQLAERFGVSRAPVRLALARLSQDGWLDYAPARGHSVRSDLPAAETHDDGEADARRGDRDIGARHAWEAIHAEVEDAITARMAFGSWQVPETALARTFGVSRTVARDVLARLQGRGLVRMDGGRWVAPGLSPQRVDELYRLRALLEPAALREIGSSLPPGLVETSIRRLEEAAAGCADGAALDGLEQDLHVDLLSFCANNTLLEAIRQPQSLLIAHRFLYRATAELFETEPFIEEHLGIVQALARGEVDVATARLHDHLMDSRLRAVLRLRALGSFDGLEDVPYLKPSSRLPAARPFDGLADKKVRLAGDQGPKRGGRSLRQPLG
ncbi:GntR family transcriptional regulator [Rubrimonas cliftonensis]|nr:GntR family transcriptional regulator [Rubrimonas cliftonensis]